MSFDASFGDFKVCQFLDIMFVYSPSYLCRDGNEGLVFHTLLCMVLISGFVFGMFLCGGL